MTLMGLGRFGGGVGAARFLARRGARLTITDLRTEDELAESLARLDGVAIERLRLGAHDPDDFREADLVVVNPAVRPGNALVRAARSAGVPTTTEVALFLREQSGRVAAVTGTNGKSTTATMLHAMLVAEGRPARLGGNIGGSLLDDVEDLAALPADHWTVLELSSFQLHHLDGERWSPNVAVVTNFSPNHLDWHGSLADYRRCKRTLLRWQAEDDVAVLNVDDPDVSSWPTWGRRVGFGTLPPADGREAARQDGVFVNAEGDEPYLLWEGRTRPLPLQDVLSAGGEHLLRNAMAAAAAATAIGLGPDAIRTGLDGLPPLPHRLELVAEVAGRRFVNDSNATTPESVRAALESFEGPVVLLAGGYDKGGDLELLAACIRDRAKAVALMGQTAPELASLLRAPEGPNLPKKVARSFEHAWAWALEQSAPGDVVLLSPGCASFDWFLDFEDRGERFRQAVRDYEHRVRTSATTNADAETRRTA